MNEFERIISRILGELGYEDAHRISLTEEIELLMFINNNSELIQHYVVSNCDEKAFREIDFEKIQMDIYGILLEQNRREPSIEKNTSWLIGVRCDKSYEDMMETILNIEENPYYFKKMVLPYQAEETKGLIDEWNSDKEFIAFLQKQVLMTNRFEKFYEKKDNVYSFISKLFIKVPSIELLISREKQLEDLAATIQEEIEKEHLLEIYEVTKSEFAEKGILEEDDINALCEKFYGEEKVDE